MSSTPKAIPKYTNFKTFDRKPLRPILRNESKVKLTRTQYDQYIKNRQSW